MRTQTSYFNATALRKDLTRFAPLWGLYTLALLCGLMLITGESDLTGCRVAYHFTDLYLTMAMVNVVYAFLVAAVLFGDLFNSRMCSGLHALPLRREGWFAVHTVSGLLSSALPTAVMTLVALPLLMRSPVENAWQLPLYFWAFSNLQFLFFFATAALAAQCVGNFVGMGLLYLLINLGALLVREFVNSMFTPLLYGVITPTAGFWFLSPVAMMMEQPLFDLTWTYGTPAVPMDTFTFAPSEHWGYLLGCAGLGLVLLAAACLLYRRRELETAGDFVALPWLAPVAAVCFAVLGCAVFHFGYVFVLGIDGTPNYVFAFVGLVVGWFAGQMCLQRTTRVFRARTAAGAAVMAAVLGVSLLAVKMDILGIQTSVPDADEIVSANLNQGYYSANAVCKDPEDIEQVRTFHRLALEQGLTNQQLEQEREAMFQENNNDWEDYYASYRENVALSYQMKDGREITRQYNIRTDSEAGEILRQQTSRLDVAVQLRDSARALPVSVENAQQLLEHVRKPYGFNIDGNTLDSEYLTEENVRALFEAIIADCQDGTLSQLTCFHPLVKVQTSERSEDYYLTRTFGLRVDLTSALYLNLDFGTDSTHVYAWAEAMGLNDLLTILPADTEA